MGNPHNWVIRIIMYEHYLDTMSAKTAYKLEIESQVKIPSNQKGLQEEVSSIPKTGMFQSHRGGNRDTLKLEGTIQQSH